MSTVTDAIFIKIKSLGHSDKKQLELKEYCKLKYEQIINLMPHHILTSNGAEILNSLFDGLSDHPISKKVKIVDIVLQSYREHSASLKLCSDVFSALCRELPRYPVEDLVRWCNDSVQTIIDDSDVNMIWRHMLPECLNAISSHGRVNHCGTDMTDAEFKEQCVRALCQFKWKEKHYVQLTSMFQLFEDPAVKCVVTVRRVLGGSGKTIVLRSTPQSPRYRKQDFLLTRKDHLQVVNKICSCMEDISPDNLPPLVHQLLKLCNVYDIDITLSHLALYFDMKLYSKLTPPENSESTSSMDIEVYDGHDTKELIRCLSTCLYHISRSADAELIRKHLKQWPRSQLLRSPFLLDVALAAKDQCTDVVRSAIEQRVMDDIMYKESAWVRTIPVLDLDIASLLKVLTTESANHRDLTVLSLISLAFGLLATSRAKQEAPTCWSHANLILVRLCKMQPESAPHVLDQLTNYLTGGGTQSHQYAECLHVLCRLAPQPLERCPALHALLQRCEVTGDDHRPAAAVLRAVHPLLNFSARVRDALLLSCKALFYSRDSVHRCLALSGLLTLLRHVRLPACSGSSDVLSEPSSAYSYFTQVSLELHTTQSGTPVTSRMRNEALCIEVASMLKRCLMQDSVVKQLLYSNIYECVKQKSLLQEQMLEMLHDQLIVLFSNRTNGSPILWEKCIQTKNDGSVILMEPIGHLIFVIAQLVQEFDGIFNDETQCSQVTPGRRASPSRMLNKLLARSNDLCDINLDGEVAFSELTPEARMKLQQSLQCYEALFAHQVIQCRADSETAAGPLVRLQKAHNRLLDYTKSTPKSSKKGAKAAESTRSQRSQSSKTNKAAAASQVKTVKVTLARAPALKSLPCLWSLSLCEQVIDLLYSEEVSWCSTEQRDQVRTRREFHAFVLRNVQSVVTREDLDKEDVLTHVVHVARVLYDRCLAKFEDLLAFDEHTALACIELLKDCLNLLLSQTYERKLMTILLNITGAGDSTAAGAMAVLLRRVRDAGRVVVAGEGEEAGSRRLHTAVVQLAALALAHPISGADRCPAYVAMISEYENYVRESKSDCSALLWATLVAGSREHTDTEFMDDLLLKLGSVLGNIDEAETDTETCSDVTQFPWMDSRRGQSALCDVCGAVGRRMVRAARVVARAADLRVVAALRKDLKKINISLVVQLCQLSTWTGAVCRLRCSMGPGSDRVLQTAMRLYSLLSGFIKHLTASVQAEDVSLLHTIRVEHLLKLSGRRLSTTADDLITYVEASSTAARHTRHIPRLVLQVETYSKQVALLAARTKLNYEQYMSLGTARDFRIDQKLLEIAEQPEIEDDHASSIDIISPAESEAGENSDEDTSAVKRPKMS